MGLDMYLIDKEDKTEAAYWRKANAIHGWFVDNVQHGNDNCEEYIVSIEKMQELVELCEKVLNSLKGKPKGTIEVKSGWANGKDIYRTEEVYLETAIAEVLLPPQQGFFFGSYDINEWYVESLESTILQLKPLIERGGVYTYCSSW